MKLGMKPFPPFFSSLKSTFLWAFPSGQDSVLLLPGPRFNPWVGKIPWRRACNPFQYSCLDIPMDRGAWQAALSSGIWNLGVFSRRCTGESLPLRGDFIHRVEFEEVSGHRVLIKRGAGNRGASQRGSTHEATSGNGFSSGHVWM